MPPKQKFTREEIIEAALKITRIEGIAAVTARRLGAELNSSSRPIFTVFKNMNEVVEETKKAARALYNQYVNKALSERMPFKATGIAYIRFAMNEPRLFQLLFMTENQKAYESSEVLSVIDENSGKILESIRKEYGLDDNKAHMLYRILWIFTHGIATLHVTDVCRFTDEETGKMLTDVCLGILMKMKAGD